MLKLTSVTVQQRNATALVGIAELHDSLHLVFALWRKEPGSGGHGSDDDEADENAIPVGLVSASRQ